MADDLVDWADVAAIRQLAIDIRDDEHFPVAAAAQWHALGGPDRDRCDRVAAALREAFRAGQREAPASDRTLRPAGCLCTWEEGDSPCPVHVTDEETGELLATIHSQQYSDELRTLRRELAARRAVDGWLAGGNDVRCLVHLGTKLRSVDRDSGEYHDGADYPALAAALGLEVDGE